MAFTQKQTIPISFQGGLAQKQDLKQVQSPNLLALENAQFDKVGQLNKRPGYDILPKTAFSGNDINAAYAIDSFNGELNLFDNLSLYSFSPSARAWANRGPAISLVNTVDQIIRSPAAQQINPDCTSLKDIDVYAWEDSRGGCRYSVLDHKTGTYIVADQPLIAAFATGLRPKTIVFNDLIYIFYTNKSVLYYQKINPNVPNIISTPFALISDGLNDNFTYDVCTNPVQSGLLYLSYFNNSFNLVAMDMDSNGNLADFTTVATGFVAIDDTNFLSVNIVGDDTGNNWISWSSGNAVYTSSYLAADFSPILSATLIEIVQCPLLAGIQYLPNSGQLQLCYEVFNSNPSNERVEAAIITQSGAITNIGTLRSVGIASKPYYYNGNNFINLAFQSVLQSTYFGIFLTYTPFTIISKVSPDNGGGLRTNNTAAECTAISPGVFLWANLTKGRFISEDNTNFALLGVQGTLSDFTNINKFNSTTFSNNLLFVGGILQNYDGVTVNEQNFHVYSEGITAVQSVGAGQLTTDAEYQYQIVYAWTDNFGQIQYGTPSPTLTIQLTGGNNTVTLTIPTLRLTAKKGVVIQVYRTLANGGDSGQPVFYVTTSLLTPPDNITGLGGGGILNDTTVDTVTFTDLAADTAIQTNQPIYTQGGILPNSAPPSCSMISLFQDRVILGGLEDPNSLWYSQTKSNNSSFNTIPAEFSFDNVISISEIGGPISALGLMDQNLIIFKENAVFILAGSGPNNAGGGNQYSDAQLITQQVGCTNPNSVILFGQGIAFQTPDKGIWLIDRNLSPPTYLGAGVDDVALHYMVSSATLDPNSNSIIFTTFNGPAMVYDYLVGQWSTFTNHEAVDSVSFQNLFTMVKSDGMVYQQDPEVFYDGYISKKPEPYSMSVTTPWISFGNILGYQRLFHIYLLGTYKGPHTLNVSIGYNFDESFTQIGAINTTLTAGSNLWGSDPTWGKSTPWGGAWNPYIYQINPAVQQCTSFRLMISDSQTPPYNEGYALSTILLEIGVVPGVNGPEGLRLPKTNKIGVRIP